jgi:hypothetical protein
MAQAFGPSGPGWRPPGRDFWMPDGGRLTRYAGAPGDIGRRWMTARGARPVDPGDRGGPGGSSSHRRLDPGRRQDPGRPGRRSAQRKRKPPALGRGFGGHGPRPGDQASSASISSNTRSKAGPASSMRPALSISKANSSRNRDARPSAGSGASSVAAVAAISIPHH